MVTYYLHSTEDKEINSRSRQETMLRMALQKIEEERQIQELTFTTQNTNLSSPHSCGLASLGPDSNVSDEG